ncbi:hypothetical protein [Adhaeribacter soli]|uniref:Uncharacterized protein n=1 Tax=Adhaeribacter soli TaxID=2607655 RepID=A0A5N1IJQ8_9BACT|nr:hypothetical protein [Adhaeribacter soli]KAA9326005.1 hypothetical protein F0P94_16440 [Adhaeribacter soli]
MRFPNFIPFSCSVVALALLFSCSSENKPTATTQIDSSKDLTDTIATTPKPDPKIIEAEQYTLTTGHAGKIKLNMSSDSLKAMVPAENLKTVQRVLEGVPYTAYELRNAQSGNQLLLLAEESCANQNCTIFRIRVVSPKFKTDKGVRVGSTFADVKNAYPLSFIGIGESDYVAVSDENKMTFTLDITHFPPKELAKVKPEEIPDSTKVTSIMLF